MLDRKVYILHSVYYSKNKERKICLSCRSENKWINGKVVQKHIRYVGRELNGDPVSGSLANAVTKVTCWAPLLVLDHSQNKSPFRTLGNYGGYLLSVAYAHCLDPKSVNKPTDIKNSLHKMLNIADVSEKSCIMQWTLSLIKF